MTDILERPKSAISHAGLPHATTPLTNQPLGVDWVHTDIVEPAVWIGRYKGAYLGMIEERPAEGFVSLTRLGRNLGRFDTIEDAQAAFLNR